MDIVDNPFSPGAGTPPPSLAGREDTIFKAKTLLMRVQKGRPEKSIILTGLRGVGKTVLLNEIDQIARQLSYKTLFTEAHSGKSLAGLLAPNLESILFGLDKIANMGDKAKKALRVLKAFVSKISVKFKDVSVGIDLDPEKGIADTGDLEFDLPALLVSVAEAAKEKETGIALIIDEIQYLTSQELSALIMTMHKMQQQQLPLVLIAAGLPIIPALAGQSKTYAERLFNFPTVEALSKDDVITALQEPVKRDNVVFSDEAIEEIYRQTQGYPYFIQEWGYQAWNQAKSPLIVDKDIFDATTIVQKRLDENFFRVRFDRVTEREKKYLRTMSEIGSGPYTGSQIANLLKTSIHSIAPVRSSLIKKGMIYSPSYGEIDFTVPLFGDFMRRIMPDRF